MKKSLMVVIIGLLLVGALVAACSPKSSSPSTPAAQSSQPKTSLGAGSDDTWNKLIDAAKKEGSLTAYSFNLAGDPGKAIAKAFTDRYGISVELVTGPGSVLVERIKSEKAAGKGAADTFDSAASLLLSAKNQGLTDSAGSLPELAAKDIWYVSPFVDTENHVIGVSPLVVTPYVNTKLVKQGDEPKSFKDLLLPAWKGKIAIGTPSIVQIFDYVYEVRSALGLDDDYWRQLAKQDLQIAPGLRETDALLVQGQAAIELPGTTSTLAPLILQGAPIKAIAMKEGVLLGQGPSFSVVKNAPHPNAARLFVNWLLSPEGQNVMSKARGVESMRKDVPSSTPPAAQVSMEKIIPVTAQQQIEIDRMMQDNALAKLMGIKDK